MQIFYNKKTLIITFLFHIGFLDIRITDILDILIVGYLIYTVYKVLRGTIAFNIFIGVLFIYFMWWLVRILEMDMLSKILTQFVNVGVIVTVIIFQQEIRRFLLLLGRNTYNTQLRKIAKYFTPEDTAYLTQEEIKSIIEAIQSMGKSKTGALLIFIKEQNTGLFYNTGTNIDALISKELLLTIFKKNSALHDGAALICCHKIKKAGCVLPLTQNQNIPSNLGLRHRAALGITEQSSAIAITVSEETGHFSLSKNGHILNNISLDKIKSALEREFREDEMLPSKNPMG